VDREDEPGRETGIVERGEADGATGDAAGTEEAGIRAAIGAPERLGLFQRLRLRPLPASTGELVPAGAADHDGLRAVDDRVGEAVRSLDTVRRRDRVLRA